MPARRTDFLFGETVANKVFGFCLGKRGVLLRETIFSSNTFVRNRDCGPTGSLATISLVLATDPWWRRDSEIRLASVLVRGMVLRPMMSCEK